jgi:hypothetical protein
MRAAKNRFSVGANYHADTRIVFATRAGKIAIMTQHPDFPLGGFDWVDRDSTLWPLFARWLINEWYSIYSPAFNNLPGVVIDLRGGKQTVHKPASLTWGDAYGAMETAVGKLVDELPKHPSREQLALVHAEALKLGLSTTCEQVENELERFLTFQERSDNATLLKASPWCNYFANEKHIFEQAGTNLPYKLYPRDPNMRLVLSSVIGEFGSLEIWRQVSPALRVRRLQRALYYAVRRLCKPKDGPEKLATFVQNLLEAWPQIPAGMEFDLENHFNADKRRELVRGHLGLEKLQSNKEARALWRVLHAVIFRDELRGPLLRLAHDADMRAKQRRKGWEHLRHALRIVFKHIRREASDEAQFRNFERSNFPHMRNLTREQRMRLLPELGNDPDHSVRDLTKKERMILAARYLKKTRTALEKDADGKNSFATRYGRAMKDVRKELGLD